MRVTQRLASWLVLLAAAGCGGSSARASIVLLGPPTSAMQSWAPLGSWQRVGPFLRQHRKPVLLFIGTKFEESAPMRWPIAKALEQFGTFQGLAPDTRAACSNGNAIPTFDWTRARYKSGYVAFDHKELLGYHGESLQRLSPTEAVLFRHYVGSLPYGNGCGSAGAWVYRTVSRLPLVSVGGYLLRGGEPSLGQEQFYTSSSPSSQQALSLAAIQAALRSGSTNPSSRAALVAASINGEANVIIALICRADGRRPARACGRPVIRQLLRHIR